MSVSNLHTSGTSASNTDRQTDRQTRLSHYLAALSGAKWKEIRVCMSVLTYISFRFILFCSSNQQSQAVAVHNDLDSKATKH